MFSANLAGQIASRHRKSLPLYVLRLRFLYSYQDWPFEACLGTCLNENRRRAVDTPHTAQFLVKNILSSLISISYISIYYQRKPPNYDKIAKKIYSLLYSKHFYVVIRIGECQFSSSSIRPVDNVFGPMSFV